MTSHDKNEKIEKFYRVAKHFGVFIFLLLILSVGGKFRLQGLSNIPTGQFASNDAYLYYSHAKTIVQDGTLPKVETHRWVPLGRDLQETLHGYPYAVAYAYKLIKHVFPNVTVYQVLLFTPTICFLIGLVVLCLFLYIRFGFSVAAIVGTLLIIMPGSIERSAAGFSDRDCWCWMLGTLAVTTYLWKENTTSKHTRYLCTVLSGFFVFLGGLSWEGFGGFVLAIVAVELWRFLTTDVEERLWEYVLWVLMFVPPLYILFPAYHRGGGFSTHVTAFLLFPSLVMLLFRTLRYYLTREHHFVSRFISEQVSARVVSLVFCAVCLFIGIAYLTLKRETFVQSIVPFSGASVMASVGELKSPHDIFWYGRYGHVLLIASLCLIVGCIRIWGKKALILAFTFSLFTAATFLRQYLYHVLSPIICEYLFYSAVAFTPIAALGVAVLRTEPVKHEYTYVAFTFWLLLWLGLARDAQRYDFFIGVPLAFLAVIGIQCAVTRLSQGLQAAAQKATAESTEAPLEPKTQKSKPTRRRKKHKSMLQLPKQNPRFPYTWVKAGITITCLALILFWEPPGSNLLPGLAQRGYKTQIEPEHVFPGKHTPMASACQWLDEHLSIDKVIAASWSYGHMLNALGGVKTVIDPDHFIVHWIELYEQHVSATTSEREALEFLKTHHVTHLLLSEEDVLYITLQHTHTHAHADELPKHPIYMMPLVPRVPLGSPHYRMVPLQKNTSINFIEINFHHNPATVTARLKNGKTVKLPYIKYFGNQVKESQAAEESNNANGGILHFFDSKTQREIVYYLSPHSWNSLPVKLYFRNEHSEAFFPVYPEENDATAKVKIWEIHYPPDIEENPKYLATSPGKGRE